MSTAQTASPHQSWDFETSLAMAVIPTSDNAISGYISAPFCRFLASHWLSFIIHHLHHPPHHLCHRPWLAATPSSPPLPSFGSGHRWFPSCLFPCVYVHLPESVVCCSHLRSCLWLCSCLVQPTQASQRVDLDRFNLARLGPTCRVDLVTHFHPVLAHFCPFSVFRGSLH